MIPCPNVTMMYGAVGPYKLMQWPSMTSLCSCTYQWYCLIRGHIGVPSYRTVVCLWCEYIEHSHFHESWGFFSARTNFCSCDHWRHSWLRDAEMNQRSLSSYSQQTEDTSILEVHFTTPQAHCYLVLYKLAWPSEARTSRAMKVITGLVRLSKRHGLFGSLLWMGTIEPEPNIWKDNVLERSRSPSLLKHHHVC